MIEKTTPTCAPWCVEHHRSEYAGVHWCESRKITSTAGTRWIVYAVHSQFAKPYLMVRVGGLVKIEIDDTHWEESFIYMFETLNAPEELTAAIRELADEVRRGAERPVEARRGAALPESPTAA